MTPDDFAAFYLAIHDQPPFPWQDRLARQVARDGRWPDVLDIPTGLGKTAVLDIAVFALAYRAASDPRNPGLPRRTVLMVDRRIVVDAAFQRARTIATALRDAQQGILAQVAAALRSLHGATADGEDPLRVVQLRGGMYRDNSWATDPAQALLVCSTVDQVGSRLLFRGYGLSEFARPIHAGLLGMDCHLVLDEAHLSEPFRQTATALARDLGPGSTGLSVMVMTATPGQAQAKQTVFRLLPEERAHPIISKRLGARKLAALERVRLPEDAQQAEIRFADVAADAAIAHIAREGVRVVAVVVNRVATARATFAAVGRRLAKLGLAPDTSSLLLTGRSRPVERDLLIDGFWERLKANRIRGEHLQPLVVVATQCIEAGADLDVDALVSESASLDALRQRFGRLDRLGERGESGATILHRDMVPDDIGDVDGPSEKEDPDSPEDPIYGAALVETWKWLNGQVTKTKHGPVVDFGIEALAGTMAGLPTGGLDQLLAPKSAAPVLLPSHLDAWVQTSPAPTQEPPVSVFLHGLRPGPADVQVVWRCDLDAARPERWADVVGLLPPISGEALSLPIGAVTAWLEERLGQTGRVLRWFGCDDDRTDAVALRDPDTGKGAILPGDTIILPATLGGVDRYGWNPTSAEPVLDLAEIAWLQQRQTPTIRLAIPPEAAEDASSAEAILDAWLNAGELPAGVAIVTPADARTLEWDTDIRRQRDDLTPETDRAGSWVWTGRLAKGGEDFTGDDDASALLTPRRRRARPVTLADHSRGVEAWARRFATACGLDAVMVETLAFAGWVHDVGKADPRFQAWLVGGDPLAARRLPHLMAKSSRNRSRVAMRLARERSGYPAGARHEVQSLAMLQHAPACIERCRQGGIDVDLVLHLVASHHGRCRPFAPVVVDQRALRVRMTHVDGSGQDLDLEASTAHELERIGSGVAARFWRMVRRHGAHRLAWYEAILRLADQRRSREEQEAMEASP